MAVPKWRGPPPRDAANGPRKRHSLAGVDTSSITNRRPYGQESRKSLRARIFEYVAANPGCTFQDIESLHGCRGDYALKTSGGVFLWSLSRPAGRAVLELLQQGLIEARDADLSDYEKPAHVETIEVIPGWRAKAVRVPLLPVVTNHRLWVPTPHWCPTTLRVTAWASHAEEARAH